MPLIPPAPAPVHDHHLLVSRSARYAVLGEDVARPTELWFVLHGYGQLAAPFLASFQPLADGTRCIYAPEALNRYYLDGGLRHGPHSPVGATWMTREDRLVEIADIVRYLDALYRHALSGLERASVRVVVVGFSQGAAAAARWVALGGARPDELVLWGAPVPAELDLAVAGRAWVATRLTLVYGRNDPSLDEARALAEAERLRAGDIAPELLGFDGGHVIDADVLLRLAAKT